MGKAFFLAVLLLICPALAREKPTRDILCATVIVIAGDGAGTPQADQMLDDVRQSWLVRTGQAMSPTLLATAMLACVNQPALAIDEVFSTLLPPPAEPQVPNLPIAKAGKF